MKSLLFSCLGLVLLAGCASGPSVRYRLTMDVVDSADVQQLTQQTMNVMQRRLSAMGEVTQPSVESTTSGSVIVQVEAEHAEALDALTEQMTAPFDFHIMAQAQGKEKADVTVEKFGGFVKTSITGEDLSWVEADQQPGTGSGTLQAMGRVHLVFTIGGRNEIAALFKKMKGKNIGIFVRGQLVSLLQVETDELKEEIVIQEIPNLELAQTFADDVNVGIHVTVTPLP